MSLGDGKLMLEISAALRQGSGPRFVHSVLWEIARSRGAWTATTTGRRVSHSLDSSFKRALLSLFEKGTIRRETRRFGSVAEVISLYPDVSREERVRKLRRLALKVLPAFLSEVPHNRFDASDRELHVLVRRKAARSGLQKELADAWESCDDLLRAMLSGSAHFDFLMTLMARGRMLFRVGPTHVSTASTFTGLAKYFDRIPTLTPAESMVRAEVQTLCDLAFPLQERRHVALKNDLYKAFNSAGHGASHLTPAFVEYLTRRRIKGLCRLLPQPRIVLDYPLASPPDPQVHRILERDVYREWEFLSPK